jgi:hypothetical protein
MRKKKEPGSTACALGGTRSRRLAGGLSPALRRVIWLTAAACFLLCVFVPGLIGKEKKPSRVVRGAVLDAKDNPISGAVVILTDLSTGKQSATFTGDDGRYQYSDLNPMRDYEVQAKYKDMSSEVRKVSYIDPRNRIVIDLRIPPPKD